MGQLRPREGHGAADSGRPRRLGDPAARADRAYQIAAAHFYAGEWDAAVRASAPSPPTARRRGGRTASSLAGRALLRKGMIGGADGALDQAALGEAVAAFERVAADGGVAAEGVGVGPEAVRRSAPASRGDARRRPRAAPHAVGRRDPRGGIRRVPLPVLRDEPDAEKGAIRARRGSAHRLDRHAARRVARRARARDRALARRGQVAWLVAAMLRVPPGHADEAALVAAASAVPRRRRPGQRWRSIAPGSCPRQPAGCGARAGGRDGAGVVRVAGRARATSCARWICDWRRAPTPSSPPRRWRPSGSRPTTTRTSRRSAPPSGSASSTDALDLLNERLPLSRLIDASRGRRGRCRCGGTRSRRRSRAPCCSRMPPRSPASTPTCALLAVARARSRCAGRGGIARGAAVPADALPATPPGCGRS